jgi:radical SAM protein with 4Fe4S-binding SPASM domain
MKLPRVLGGHADPIAPDGLASFRVSAGGVSRRVHLRAGPQGGVLVIDASKVLHLNPTAVDFAWLILRGYSDREAIRRMRSRYSVSADIALRDYESVRNALDCMLSDVPVCPVTFLGLDRIEPFTTPVSAPYRADLALTYACNISCSHCYNESRDKPEMDAESWRKVMNRLWDIGIPHVCFTGGEATLRSDLVSLIAHAESIGMVTGLLTNGVKLADASYLSELAGAGLDYVQITLESHIEETHNKMVGARSYGDTVKAIENCAKLPIYVITNTTITKINKADIPDTVDFLARAGLKAFAVNSIISSGRAVGGDHALSPDELAGVLGEVHRRAEKAGLRMIWYSPTRYCELDPLALELGPKRCTAAQYNICVEPDGAVLPCQSYYESAGNILVDTWESIYGGRLFTALRNRDWTDDACRGCESFALCGGGCPLEKEGKASACPDMLSNP